MDKFQSRQSWSGGRHMSTGRVSIVGPHSVETAPRACIFGDFTCLGGGNVRKSTAHYCCYNHRSSTSSL